MLVLTGKGGAGKTTVSALLANLAAREGMNVMVVQIGTPGTHQGDDHSPLQAPTGHLPGLFGVGQAVAYEPALLSTTPAGGQVWARSLAPDTALVEYLNQHGMRRLSRRLLASGALEVVATAVPGMPDMLVLGKVKQMERAAAGGQPGAPALIILDAPAAGHAVRFLEGPRAILEAASGGPIRSQAEEVAEMLSDPARCQVLLVTTAEETPVTETLETAELLASGAGTHIGAVVVNARLPVLSLPAAMSEEDLGTLSAAAGVILDEGELTALVAAGRLRSQRQGSQASQVARLAEGLAVPQLEVPFCFSTEMGKLQLETLTDALATSVEAFVPVTL